MKQQAIVRVEVSFKVIVHCPYCGNEALNPQKAQGDQDVFSPCPHTLFFAHDEGFEYRSDRFDVAAGIVNVESGDIELPEYGVDGFTDQIKMAGAVKFASYVPAPVFFGMYIGFAPI